jgi:polyferredoxin
MVNFSFIPSIPRRLRTLRRYWAIGALALFVVLVLVTDYRYMAGYETSLFLELSPLTAVGAFFTSGTFYKGLLLSLLVVVPTLFLGRFFCSWVCPFGILHQFLGWVFAHRRPAEAQTLNAYRPSFQVKYYLLAALLVLAALGSLQIGLLDPIAFLMRSVTTTVVPALDRLGVPVHLKPPVFWGGALITALLLASLFATTGSCPASGAGPYAHSGRCSGSCHAGRCYAFAVTWTVATTVIAASAIVRGPVTPTPNCA